MILLSADDHFRFDARALAQVRSVDVAIFFSCLKPSMLALIIVQMARKAVGLKRSMRCEF